MKGIDKVEFLLENCEVITIEGKFICNLLSTNIQTQIRGIGCRSIKKYNTCDDFLIEIHRSGDRLNTPFGIESFIDDSSIFDRIFQYKDITNVKIYYEDTVVCDEFYVRYEEDENTSNIYQKCYKNSFGDLYILISKDKLFEDYYEIETLENCSYLDVQSRLMDIEK